MYVLYNLFPLYQRLASKYENYQVCAEYLIVNTTTLVVPLWHYPMGEAGWYISKVNNFMIVTELCNSICINL
jgi:hypothetical protein